MPYIVQYEDDKEWSIEQVREYIDTLRFVIRMIDDVPDRTLDELKALLQGCIDRELDYRGFK
jgi:hypothetical protein